MAGFFRFPHTPHLAWLGSGPVRDDKVFSPAEARAFLARPVAIEEKLDGANIGLSLGPGGDLRIQQRGDHLQAPYHGQFARLGAWLGIHAPSLREFLEEPAHGELILFGEWCAARHSVAYTHLPDPFLLFDIADPATDHHAERFWSRHRRDSAAAQLGLATVPLLQEDSLHSLADLRQRLEAFRSSYHPGPPEGLILRQDDGPWCRARAKLVRADFTQAIADHWRSRAIEWNGIDYGLLSGLEA
jgi:ATP-dependent RNA circularization protein (DNA/RNA ligase family)